MDQIKHVLNVIHSHKKLLRLFPTICSLAETQSLFNISVISSSYIKQPSKYLPTHRQLRDTGIG